MENTTVNNALKAIWERDLNLDFGDEEWGAIRKNSVKMSKDIRVRLIQFKILNRFYWTPSRLHKLGLKDTVECWRCRDPQSVGTLVHALWECFLIYSFWKQVHNWVSEMSRDDFPLCPRLYILGDPRQVAGCTCADLILTSIMIGKQVLMRGWKNAGGPSFQDWLIEMSKVAACEQMIYRRTDRLEKYICKWGRYIMYIGV